MIAASATQDRKQPDHPDPARGNFYVDVNPTKTADNDRPMLQGRISLPRSTDDRTVALWAHQSENGLVFNGRTRDRLHAVINQRQDRDQDTQPSAAIRVAQLRDGKELTVEPDSVVLFTNKSREDNPARPDYFGYYNPGRGLPLMRISAWERSGPNGPVLVGPVERDEPNRAVQKDKDEPTKEKAPRAKAKTREPDRER